MADQAPVTGRFNAFHEAVTADLKSALAGVAVDEHFGPFLLEELAAYGAKAPAVRVSVAGPSPTAARSSGDREASLVVAAFVITKGEPRRPAHKSALDLAERIAARIHRGTFGLSYCEPPTEVVIENHYSGKLREHAGNVALFSVSWSQLVVFGIDTAPLPATDAPPTDHSAIEFDVV